MIHSSTVHEPLQQKQLQTNAMVITDLVIAYGRKRVVDGLTLHVPYGSVFALIGLNGAGKTTIIKALIGLRAPTSGSARVLGYDVVRQSLEVRARIGYISEVHNLYDAMTPRQLCSFCRATSRRWDQVAVDRYMDLFDLPSHQQVGRLSKGKKTQLALCLALGGDPELLILDEPTAGLDPLARHQFLNQLCGDVSAAGKTIFFSTHILSDVETIADRIGIIRNGKLALSGELDNLRQIHQVLKLTYADVPPAGEIAALRALASVASVQQEGRTVRLQLRGDVTATIQAVQARPYPLCDMECRHVSLDAIIMNYLQEDSYVR